MIEILSNILSGEEYNESVRYELRSLESLTRVTHLSGSTVVHELRRAGVSSSTLPCYSSILERNPLHLLTYRFISVTD